MRIAVCVVSLAVALVTPGAAQKMTPEALVKLHLQALTAGVPVPREQRLDVKGAVSAVTPARAAGLLPGTFRLTSGATGARLDLHFGTDLYEGETFTVEGDKVDIANAQPRTGSRSAVGNFVARNRVIVAEGLIGGVLNTRWPLHDIAAPQGEAVLRRLEDAVGPGAAPAAVPREGQPGQPRRRVVFRSRHLSARGSGLRHEPVAAARRDTRDVFAASRSGLQD